MMKARLVNIPKLWTRPIKAKTIAWIAYIKRNTRRRLKKSDNHAQKKRPAPLAIEMMPTRPAAAAAFAGVNSCSIGDAWEMMEIPAKVLRNKMAHRQYHCHVRNASPRV